MSTAPPPPPLNMITRNSPRGVADLGANGHYAPPMAAQVPPQRGPASTLTGAPSPQPRAQRVCHVDGPTPPVLERGQGLEGGGEVEMGEGGAVGHSTHGTSTDISCATARTLPARIEATRSLAHLLLDCRAGEVGQGDEGGSCPWSIEGPRLPLAPRPFPSSSALGEVVVHVTNCY